MTHHVDAKRHQGEDKNQPRQRQILAQSISTQAGEHCRVDNEDPADYSSGGRHTGGRQELEINKS